MKVYIIFEESHHEKYVKKVTSNFYEANNILKKLNEDKDRSKKKEKLKIELINRMEKEVQSCLDNFRFVNPGDRSKQYSDIYATRIAMMTPEEKDIFKTISEDVIYTMEEHECE